LITVAKGEEKNIKFSASLETSYLVAPVRVGTKVGRITVRQDDRSLLTVPIATQSAVPRGNLFKVAWGKIALFFHRIADGIMSAMYAALSKILSN
jgi:D-alanyl-D-alanine carboxypeptidase